MRTRTFAPLLAALVLGGLLAPPDAHVQRYHRTPIDGTTAGARFGGALAAGDVSGDGFQDMLVTERPGGAVRLFLGGAGFPGSFPRDTDASLTFTDPGLAERAPQFGSAIAVGDINGDGYDDVVIGSYGFPSGLASVLDYRAGAAYVYCGGPSPDTVPSLTLLAPPLGRIGPADETLGMGQHAAIGDVDGDGFGDLIMGAFSTGTSTYELYVFSGAEGYCSGSTATLHAETDAALRIGDLGITYDASLAVGDVNADNLADIALVRSNSIEDRTFVFFGSRALPGTLGSGDADVTVAFDSGGGFARQLGRVALGDLTGDGYDDLALATRADDGTGAEHRIYVHSGFALAAAAPGPVQADDTPRVLRHHAASLAIGQIDGSGPDDLLVGAPDEHGGSAFIYHGASDFVRPILGVPPPIVLLSNTPDERFGESAAVLGWTNRSPSIEIAVGAPANSARRPEAGRAYVLAPGFELAEFERDLGLDPCELYWSDTPLGFRFCYPRLIELAFEPDRLSLVGLFAPDPGDPDNPEAAEDVTARFDVEALEGTRAKEACLDPARPCLRLTLRKGAEPLRDVAVRLAAEEADGATVGASYVNGLGQAISAGERNVPPAADPQKVNAPEAPVLEASSYPNPFNPAATIAFALPEGGPVRLAVYDVLGRPVAVLVEGPLPAGRHAVRFDGSALASGPYVYRLEAGGRVLTRRMTLMK